MGLLSALASSKWLCSNNCGVGCAGIISLKEQLMETETEHVLLFRTGGDQLRAVRTVGCSKELSAKHCWALS